MELSGKRVLVMGMKASGISTGFLLKKMGADVYCYDDNLGISISDFTNISTCPEDKVLDGISLVIPSPSISKYHKILISAKEKGIPVIGELAFGAALLPCKKIMVTGTNGKTTTVTMIEKILTGMGLRAKAIGNIGFPVTQVVLEETELDYAVIEVSSFQLEHAEGILPNIAVVMNVAPDHLDRYDSYQDYVNTKKNLVRGMGEQGIVFVNNEDGTVRSFLECTKAQGIAVSTRQKNSAVYIKDNYFMWEDISLCHVKECKLRGEHNRFNLLIALNIGAVLGARREHLCNLIRDYALLPNRIEYITGIFGKNYFNDSKGTNIHACKFAIESMEGAVGLIMGGSDKNEDFCEFFESIDEKVKRVAATGGNAEKIYNSALKMGFVDIVVTKDLKEAVEYLSRCDDIANVLLSPCCASFDRYKNYAERGERFKEIVYAIEV